MSYVDFKGRCPARGCANQKVYMTWVHAGCGATMLIGDDAHLKCRNGHRYHMKNWRFKCDAHNFRDPAPEEFGNAISLAIQQMGPGGAQWASRLMLNLGHW